MDANTVKERLREGETLTLECKNAEKKLPSSVWDTYSAFANTAGGLILLGIEERPYESAPEKRFEVAGVSHPQEMLREFWDDVNNSDVVSANILTDRDAGIAEIDGRAVIWIEISPVCYGDKPIFRGQNPKIGAFKRNHEGDYHCADSELRAMYRDAAEEFDSRARKGYGLGDLDEATIAAYRHELRLLRPRQVWNELSDADFLKRIQALRVDRETGKTFVTSAGLLMFGKGEAIDNEYPTLRFDYIDETNLKPGQRWSDRLLEDGSWENNIYNYLQIVLPKLHQGLPRPFHMEDGVRRDESDVHTALREALVNMVVHCDYAEGGALVAKKFPGGYSFSNPGTPLPPIDEIYGGGFAYTRNPTLQKMLLLIGYGESMGSGFSVIQEAWRGNGWRLPALEERARLGCTELRLWTSPLDVPEAEEYFRCEGAGAYDSLTEVERRALTAAYVERRVSIERVARLLEIDARGAREVLEDLEEERWLIRHDSNDWRLPGNGRSGLAHASRDASGEPTRFGLARQDYDSRARVRERLLSETDMLICELIREKENATPKDIVDSPRIETIATESGARAALRRLRESGRVERIRQGRSFVYRIANDREAD